MAPFFILLHHCVTSDIQSAQIPSSTIDLSLGGVIGVTTSPTPKKDLKKQLMEMKEWLEEVLIH
ncbi:Hypothetical protein P9303_28151 [Prochlorococcus marinus str. MIT 9303]|uniref:Uncharacterized protein n=1 Tax=Prochlorococcus marinus (strain MIT 9303) TaxID=59922 RepID=A2CDI5_PROM3|nr:Hypothetical protein P9303_28151 [Prochlorococcus marinus str. MIT 9303]